MENSKQYKRLIKLHTPSSTLGKDCLMAFLFGGGLCLFGELLSLLYRSFGISSEDSYTWVTVTLIFIAAVLTTVGVFDKIAKHAGAGTLVPVTGFANSVVSCALDTRSEGYVMGVGAKIFTVAGPVILYGTVAGVIYGFIYYLVGVLG
jgi:stage V sporulation protein AC